MNFPATCRIGMRRSWIPGRFLSGTPLQCLALPLLACSRSGACAVGKDCRNQKPETRMTKEDPEVGARRSELGGRSSEVGPTSDLRPLTSGRAASFSIFLALLLLLGRDAVPCVPDLATASCERATVIFV